MTRKTQPGDLSTRSTRDHLSLVDTVIEDPELVRAVASLDGETLAELVHQVGLEDSGALLALATPAQLRQLADHDLWHSEPGREESFDPGRFAVWANVLYLEGARVAADAFLALDEDLLVLALSEQLHVLDLDALAPLMVDGQVEDADLVEKIMEASLSHEIDELLLLARQYDGWDALIDVLHEIDARDPDQLRRLLDRLCTITMDRVHEDGLHQVLSQAETAVEDARAERNDRREKLGFVASADARAFLAAADQSGSAMGADPITRSYFRTYEPASPEPPGEGASRLASLVRASAARTSQGQLPAISSRPSPTRERLSALRDADPERHRQGIRELFYLASALIAGVAIDGQTLGKQDAIHAALTFCDAGREAEGEAAAARSLVELFGAGWQAAGAQAADGGAREEARALRKRMS